MVQSLPLRTCWSTVESTRSFCRFSPRRPSPGIPPLAPCFSHVRFAFASIVATMDWCGAVRCRHEVTHGVGVGRYDRGHQRPDRPCGKDSTRLERAIKGPQQAGRRFRWVCIRSPRFDCDQSVGREGRKSIGVGVLRGYRSAEILAKTYLIEFVDEDDVLFMIFESARVCIQGQKALRA